jgi:predicted glycoside hydrolase/deacetylase ChbG (UPF0249 family)
MAPTIIVNGDDMGLSRSINGSIALLVRRGLMQSASILVKRDREGFREAIAMARALDGAGAGFGLHLDLDEYFRFDEHGRYGATEEDIVPWYGDIWKERRDDIVGDMERQLAALLDAGIIPSHVDGHHHAHLFPLVLPEVLQLMERHSITRMRFFPEFYRSDASRRRALELLRLHGIRNPDHFIDLSRLMAEGRGMLDSLEGVVEIMAHTDTGDNDLGRVEQHRYLLEGNLGEYRTIPFHDL